MKPGKDLGNPDAEKSKYKDPVVGKWCVQDRTVKAKWVTRKWWEIREVDRPDHQKGRKEVGFCSKCDEKGVDDVCFRGVIQVAAEYFNSNNWV